jgi:hypothetical protein
LFKRLVTLAGKPCKLSFLGFGGGTAAAYSYRIRRFGIALRLRALASLLLDLERRRIAHPKA